LVEFPGDRSVAAKLAAFLNPLLNGGSKTKIYISITDIQFGNNENSAFNITYLRQCIQKRHHNLL
jgi:hypothetical protein